MEDHEVLDVSFDPGVLLALQEVVDEMYDAGVLDGNNKLVQSALEALHANGGDPIIFSDEKVFVKKWIGDASLRHAANTFAVYLSDNGYQSENLDLLLERSRDESVDFFKCNR